MARTAVKPKPRRLTVALREDLARGLAPLPAGRKRVDREQCIIYGVKLAGRTSPNTHGVRGAQGTEYLSEAFLAALPQYQGAKVNVNHPPRKDPGQERDAEDRLGKIIKAYMHEGEPYGDLKLIPSHRMTPSLLDAAESDDLQDCFAMSHNAIGQGEVQGGKYVVTSIPEVRSVDVVADGGTNRSLFESKSADLLEEWSEAARQAAALARKAKAQSGGLTSAHARASEAAGAASRKAGKTEAPEHHLAAAEAHKAASRAHSKEARRWESSNAEVAHERLGHHRKAAESHQQAAIGHYEAAGASKPAGAWFHESRERVMKISVRKLLETRVMAALDRGRQKRLRRLLEDDSATGLDAETDMREDDEAGSHRDHLYAAHKACMEEGDDETGDKILGLLKSKPKEESKDTEESEDDDEEKDTEESEEEESEADRKKAQEEGRKRVTRLARGFLNLRENESPAKSLVDALVKLPDDDSRLSLLESWPRSAAAQPGRAGSAPRSASGAVPLREGAAAKSADDMATILLR